MGLQSAHHGGSSYYLFCFIHVQLAMRRFFHGPRYGISMESLSYTEVQLSDQAITTLFSVETRVCPEKTPSLCLRAQNIISVSRSKAALLSSETWFLEVCTHIFSLHKVMPEAMLRPLIERQVRGYLSGSPSGCEPDRCRHCETDYKIEVKEYDDNSLALVITKWMDIGSGLTPDDPRWRSKLPSYIFALNSDAPDAFGLVGYSRSRFENAPGGQSEETLLSRNLSYLSGKKYKAEMDRLNDFTWFLQAESRLPRSLLGTLTRALQSFQDLFA